MPTMSGSFRKITKEPNVVTFELDLDVEDSLNKYTPETTVCIFVEMFMKLQKCRYIVTLRS